ncbi:hypothetical protein BAG01nite_49520 [Brevibacillus agri]|uniref:Lipoprotein n=1 Tax=Brevibacillus agri TaxID=51101 RepID=A0A3M8BFF5_9BACL|nr:MULTISPECIES: hypothetical protein [Brevibacillus]EJL40727.1 hypothetical protein PMI08_04288 [Brevibacillus sp. CF112]MDR9504301.1 hypothetical protein [Brevibacillus agri]MED4569364.1 hypothetical protein [Brevibacillus agri]QAV12640.1 hypothetical protein BA6348_07585 [Brevibacillus agri]RNB62170.1 hypothetical protein EB820_00365 [Brevibacillus agri]
MRIKLLFTFLLLILFGALLGCQEDTSKQQNKEIIIEDTKVPNGLSKVTKDKEVESVTILESPKNASSPSEAVTYQYKVTFKDGKSAFPQKNDIVFESTLGDTSIVAIRSPEGETNYTVFLYEYNNTKKWVIDGFLRLQGGTGFMNKEGLDLPMDKFNALNLKIPKKNKKIWAFANEKEIVTIAVYNRFPFVETNDPEKITLTNKNEAYVSKENLKNSYLYYFDSGKLIVVCGNIGKQNIINLANSLPSVNSAFFPSPKEN